MIPRLPTSWFRPAPDSAVMMTLRQGKSLWNDGVHLLWSVWIFITPLFSGGYSWTWLGLTLLSYPLFLVLYALTVLRSRQVAYRYALGMVALSLVLLPWYPSGISYFIFGCVMLSVGSARFRWSYLVQLLALNAVFAAIAAWIGYPWQALIWVPIVTLVIGVIAKVDRASQEKDAALKLSHEEVRRLAASAERERIGRDLHDLLGHTLSLVALKSDLAGKLLQRDASAEHRDAALHEISEVSRVARDALAQVRSAVSGMRATGIAAELASARLLLESDGIDFSHAVAADVLDGQRLTPGMESALALTLREAATNIQRHAHARSAQVSFENGGEEAVLRIVDDGRGGAIVPGNGLVGMRERIEAAGGCLRVESARRRGTCIEARMPLLAIDDAEAIQDG